jgi:hypothetical protein
VDLYNSLVYNWSPYNAWAAMRPFCKLLNELIDSDSFLDRMKRVVFSRIGYSYKRYHSFELGQELGKEHCRVKLREFIDKLASSDVRVTWVGTRGWQSHVKLILPVTEQELSGILRGFVFGLLQPVLERSGKTIWADHSPHSYLSAVQLLKIFPECHFIHIERDIRDTISSIRSKPWGPRGDLEVVSWIKAIYSRWESQKKILPPDRHTEIWLEDLVTDRDVVLKRLLADLNLEFRGDFDRVKLDNAHRNRWQSELNGSQAGLIAEQLPEHLYSGLSREGERSR